MLLKELYEDINLYFKMELEKAPRLVNPRAMYVYIAQNPNAIGLFDIGPGFSQPAHRSRAHEGLHRWV